MSGTEKAIYRKIRRFDQGAERGFCPLQQAEDGEILKLLFGCLEDTGGSARGCRLKTYAQEYDLELRPGGGDPNSVHRRIDRLHHGPAGAAA